VLPRVANHFAGGIHSRDVIPKLPDLFSKLARPAADIEHGGALRDAREQQTFDNGSDFDPVIGAPMAVIEPGKRIVFPVSFNLFDHLFHGSSVLCAGNAILSLFTR